MKIRVLEDGVRLYDNDRGCGVSAISGDVMNVPPDGIDGMIRLGLVEIFAPVVEEKKIVKKPAKKTAAKKNK